MTQSLAILEWLDEVMPEPQPAAHPPAFERLTARSCAAWPSIIACDIHPLNNTCVDRKLAQLTALEHRRVTDRNAWIAPLDQRRLPMPWSRWSPSTAAASPSATQPGHGRLPAWCRRSVQRRPLQCSTFHALAEADRRRPTTRAAKHPGDRSPPTPTSIRTRNPSDA
jgi:hypothetical protein